MQLYIAGLFTSNFTVHSAAYKRLLPVEQAWRDEATYLLESYHYVHKPRMVELIREEGRQIFLDSGAFSAFTQGVTIDMKKYCEYILRNKDIIVHKDGVMLASVLDGIGDPLLTYQNQMAMERMGVKPLPCFHFGEDPRYLDWYVANYDYITIGGMVPIATPQLKIWLDWIWNNHLVDGAGRPKVRVHGFGLTTPMLMRRYPWYSVDSSSWVQMAKTGSIILLPEAKAVAVSSASPNRKMELQHFNTMPPVMQQKIRERLQEYGGATIERMQDDYTPRWAYNIYAYSELGRLISVEKGDYPSFTTDQLSLF